MMESTALNSVLGETLEVLISQNIEKKQIKPTDLYPKIDGDFGKIYSLFRKMKEISKLEDTILNRSWGNVENEEYFEDIIGEKKVLVVKKNKKKLVKSLNINLDTVNSI
jgi:hypothetical protein